MAQRQIVVCSSPSSIWLYFLYDSTWCTSSTVDPCFTLSLNEILCRSVFLSILFPCVSLRSRPSSTRTKKRVKHHYLHKTAEYLPADYCLIMGDVFRIDFRGFPDGSMIIEPMQELVSKKKGGK